MSQPRGKALAWPYLLTLRWWRASPSIAAASVCSLTLAKDASGAAITPQCGACAAGIDPPDASAYNASASGLRCAPHLRSPLHTQHQRHDSITSSAKCARCSAEPGSSMPRVARAVIVQPGSREAECVGCSMQVRAAEQRVGGSRSRHDLHGAPHPRRRCHAGASTLNFSSCKAYPGCIRPR